MKRILSIFKAGKTRSDYADAADLFRVLCMLLIAWFHIWQQSWLNPNFTVFGRTVNIYAIVTCGYMFVDLMLLLSGFLLMLGMLNRRTFDRRGFYIARVARIIPSYLFVLIVMFFLTMLPKLSSIPSDRALIDIFSHLTFTHNLFPEAYAATNFNAVLWTLAVEMQFYLLFPVLGKAFKKQPLLTYAAMVGFGFFYRFYISRYFTDVSLYFNRLPAMMDVYANGMLAALIYVRLSKAAPATWRAWLSTALTVIACAGICHILTQQRRFSDYNAIRAGQMHYRFMLSAAGAVVLVCGSRSIPLLRKLCSNPVTRFLSGVSFNFYMWHQWLACKLKDWHIPAYEGTTTPNQDGLMPWQLHYTLICFGGALLLSIAITYLIEKPCAKLIKKRFSEPKKLETHSDAC